MERKWSENKFVCVGLDSDLDKIPKSERVYVSGELRIADTISNFNQRIIQTTSDVAGAYKPNPAFYDAHGVEGLDALHRTIKFANKVAPDVPVVLDGKRTDIGNTNLGYVKYAFDYLKADALTVHPYLGAEALKPFLEQTDKGIIVLCRTSNPGAGEFQDLHTLTYNPRNKPAGLSAEEWLQVLCDDSMQLYERVAFNVARIWNVRGNCHLVVGATYPAEAGNVRRIVGDVPFVIPGVGEQGGEVEATVLATVDSHKWGMTFNSSRAIIFAPDPRAATIALNDAINRYR